MPRFRQHRRLAHLGGAPGTASGLRGAPRLERAAPDPLPGGGPPTETARRGRPGGRRGGRSPGKGAPAGDLQSRRGPDGAETGEPVRVQPATRHSAQAARNNPPAGCIPPRPRRRSPGGAALAGALVADRPAHLGRRAAGGLLWSAGVRLVLRRREPEQLTALVLQRNLRQSRARSPRIRQAPSSERVSTSSVGRPRERSPQTGKGARSPAAPSACSGVLPVSRPGHARRGGIRN